MRKDIFVLMKYLEEIPPNYDEVTMFLQDKDDPPSLEDLTELALYVVSLCQPEIEDILEDGEKAYEECAEHIKYSISSLKLLMTFGLDPNLYVGNGDYAMSEASDIEDGDAGAKIIKYLLENGANPNQELHGLTLFDYVSSMIVRRGEFFDNRVKCWMVLFAFGGVPKDRSFTIKTKEGFDTGRLKEYDKFTFDAVNLAPEIKDINALRYKLLIYDENNEIVVSLE
jgi:hypothetical protein